MPPGDDNDIAQTLPDPRAVSSEPQAISDPDAEVVALPAHERYETRASLGEGGMGEVRLARDRLIGREVALKLIRTEHAGRTESRQRFVREARVQGQLEHPAIVPVYDIGIDAHGDVFFTMRRLRGSTLTDILDRLRDDDAATHKEHARHKLLNAFVRVCLAISFAHERGVVHRDLKPANVMLGDFGEVYVLDWGLAKVRGASRSADPLPSSRKPLILEEGDAGTTAQGAVVGTPQYMAPEQVKGEDLDARVDVYALGAILFELLTFEPLHGDGTLAEILRRSAKGADARASVRAPHRKVPPELEAMCIHATALDRTKRYASARELADAVDAFLAGDRDTELRKELGQKHLDLARAAADRARTQTGDAVNDQRAAALAEVAQALALAPSDPIARSLLIELLTEPPTVPPPEVRRAIDARARAAQDRMLMPAAAMYTFGWVSFIPAQIIVGVKDWTYALMPALAFTATGGLCLLASRVDEPMRSRVLRLIGLASCIAMAFLSVMYGVLIGLPSAVAVNTMGIVLVTPKSRRPWALLFNVSALFIPFLLTYLDLHPVRHTFPSDGTLVIDSSVLALPRTATFISLGLTYLAIIGLAAIFAARYRDALTRAELANEMNAWQLRQLLPRHETSQGLKSIAPPVPP